MMYHNNTQRVQRRTERDRSKETETAVTRKSRQKDDHKTIFIFNSNKVCKLTFIKLQLSFSLLGEVQNVISKKIFLTLKHHYFYLFMVINKRMIHFTFELHQKSTKVLVIIFTLAVLSIRAIFVAGSIHSTQLVRFNILKQYQ